MKIQANTVRVGNVLERDGKLWVVSGTQIVQPGKGGAFIQIEMKDIRSGPKPSDRYRTSEPVDRALLGALEFQ